MNIEFNPLVKLVFADVDETIADVYTDADPEMIIMLDKYLESGRYLFLVSGGGLQSIMDRVCLKIKKNLRHRILVSHCSGAEVWGFDKPGELNDDPFYSLYDKTFSQEQKIKFREIVENVIEEYHLQKYPTMKLTEFSKISEGDPKKIMFIDRGPQITLEMVNAYAIKDENGGIIDLRVELASRFAKEFEKYNIPTEPSISGVFALDLKIKGASKITSIKYFLEHNVGLDLVINKGKEHEEMEIWGDKFSEVSGTDRYICYALSKAVRAIDFRDEDPSELPKGYNIVFWDGQKRLHEGCLEYLRSFFN